MYFGRRWRHEICWHRKVAAKSSWSANPIFVSIRAVGHCNQPERYGSSNHSMERSSCYVMLGKCTRTMDYWKWMVQRRCPNFKRKSTIYVVVCRLYCITLSKHWWKNKFTPDFNRFSNSFFLNLLQSNYRPYSKISTKNIDFINEKRKLFPNANEAEFYSMCRECFSTFKK